MVFDKNIFSWLLLIFPLPFSLLMLSGLRIGSRRSDLARLQAKLVGAKLGTLKYIFKEAPGDINLKDMKY